MVEGLIELETRGRDNKKGWYAKIRPIVQTTGTGKSKLVERLGEQFYTLRFVLRKPMEIAFPPRDIAVSELLLSTHNEGDDVDPDVYDVLLRRKYKYFDKENKDEQGRRREEIKPLAKLVWYHAIVAGFLQAAFEYVTINVSQDSGIQHDLFAPKDWNKRLQHDPNVDGQIWSEKSKHRLDMSNTIVEKAKEIALALVMNDEWQSIWMGPASKWGPTLRDLQDSIAMGLRKAADTLIERLPEKTVADAEHGGRRFPPSFVLVIDEASNMPVDLIHAFGRTLSLIRDKSIWTLFLSTESKLADTWPADDQLGGSASSRALSQSIQEGDRMGRPPPFIAFTVAGLSSTWKEARNISLKEAMSINNMAVIGRPLWKAYLPPYPPAGSPLAFRPLEQIISYKLLGSETKASLKTLIEQMEPGDAKQREKFRRTITASVFTCLTFLVLLDPAVQSTGYLSLMILLVDRYLRVLEQWDMSAGFIKTMTPCEPIVSHYSRILLRGLWDTALQKLADHLLHDGAVSKGLCGELFVRVLFILARDCVRKSDHNPFTLKNLLAAMFGRNDMVFGKLPDKILEVSLNFNHFTDTKTVLRHDNLEELCDRLIRTCTALQHKEGQTAFDCSLPFEFAATNHKPFRGLIYAQSKLQAQSTNPADMLCTGSPQKPASVKTIAYKGQTKPLDQKSSTRGIPAMKEVLLRKSPDGQPFPALVILFDLGCDMKRDSDLVLYKGEGKENSNIYVLHAKGHGRKLFQCLKTQGVSDATVNKLFSELARDQQPISLEEIVCANRIFG